MLVFVLLALWAVCVAACVIYARRLHYSVLLAAVLGIVVPLPAAIAYAYIGISGDRRGWSIVLVAVFGAAALGIAVAVILASIRTSKSNGYGDASTTAQQVQHLPDSSLSQSSNNNDSVYLVQCDNVANSLSQCRNPRRYTEYHYSVTPPSTVTLTSSYAGQQSQESSVTDSCAVKSASNWTCNTNPTTASPGNSYGFINGTYFDLNLNSESNIIVVTQQEYFSLSKNS